MDRGTFAGIMMALSAVYPNRSLPPKGEGLQEALDAYYALLHDLPSDVFQAAAQHHAATSKWFPTAAELREQTFELIDRAQGRISAYQAWDEVLTAVGSVGVYRGEPEWSDPGVAYAVAGVGGWRAICMTPEQSLFSTRARFLEAFKQRRYEERTDQRALPQVRELVKRLSMGAERPALEGGR